MAWNMKGKVTKCDHREYGFAQLKVKKFGTEGSSVDALFEGLGDGMQVMHRGLWRATAANRTI